MYKSNYRSRFLQKAVEKHGNTYDYTTIPEEFTFDTWVSIKCSTHGLFTQRARTHVAGSRCPHCMHAQRYQGKRHTKDTFVERARKVHGDFYDYSVTVYGGQMKQVEVNCPRHGIFTVVANNHIHGTGCAKCKRSRGEITIQNWLEDHNISYESQKTFDGLHLPVRKKRTNKPKFDFYCPVQRVLIEFDGLHHFKPVKFNGVSDEEAVYLHERTKLSDEIKDQFAAENGLRLLRISHSDFKHIADILASVLLV